MSFLLKKILYILAILMELYSFFGTIIYGGVFWGKLKYWNDGNSAADHIWLIALLQWIFGIVFPIGSFIVNCMIIHSTRSSNCNPHHIQFPDAIQIKIKHKYDNFPSQKYFNERCSLPRKLFISFLICDLVSSTIMVSYKATEYLKTWKQRKDEAEDEANIEEKDESNMI